MHKFKISSVILTLITFLVCCALFCSSPFSVYAASLGDNAVIVMSGEAQDDTITVRANLAQNSAISDMLLNLNYDRDALELTNVTRGSALSSLDFEKTPTYKLNFFKILYSNKTNTNDTSTGTLFTMTFKLKSKVENKSYTITLDYTRDKDVCYIDGTVKTKNLVIEPVVVNVKSDLTIDVETVSGQGLSWWVIALIVAGGLTVIILLVVLLRPKKKKDWERL